MDKEINDRLLRRASRFSVAVACILIVIKLFSYILTSSVSMLSSLVDSSLDAIASAVNMYAVCISLQPPDKQHRFGHGKAEPIGGLFQAAFIFGSGIFLLVESFRRFFVPSPLYRINSGIIVMLISLAFTFALIIYQKYVVKKTSSVAIEADMTHYSGDIMMNIGVILSLLIYKYLNFQYIDTIFSFVISLYLIYNAYHIGNKAIDFLMDHELPENVRTDIVNIATTAPDVCGIHAVKTRSAGSKYFIQLDLELDPYIPLIRAHDIADDIERKIKSRYPNSEVIVHQDPTTEKPHGL